MKTTKNGDFSCIKNPLYFATTWKKNRVNLCHGEHYYKLICTQVIDMLNLNKANTSSFVKYATLDYVILYLQP